MMTMGMLMPTMSRHMNVPRLQYFGLQVRHEKKLRITDQVGEVAAVNSVLTVGASSNKRIVPETMYLRTRQRADAMREWRLCSVETKWLSIVQSLSVDIRGQANVPEYLV